MAPSDRPGTGRRRERGGAGYLLALDAGIGGGRCLIFAPDGRLVARGYEEWVADAVPGVPGGLSFDPHRYWAALCRAVGAALVAGDLRPEQIAAISATCMREGCLLLDDAGIPVYAGPSADVRGAPYNAELAERHGVELYAITGHLPQSFHLPGRLRWLRDHEPDAFGRGRRLMMINDWIIHRLCGAWTSEPSNACSSALFDVRNGTWSDRAIALADLPRDIFAPIVTSGTRVGELSSEAAAETGLATGTPVVVGGGDAQLGALGVGAVGPGATAAIAGTTTPILMHLDQPLFDPERRTWTRADLRPGRWALEANAGITGLAFRWLRDLLYESPSEQSYAVMARLAEAAPAGARGVRSFLGPKPMTTRWWAGLTTAGRLTGVGPFDGGRAEIIRATMESACYGVRANCELLAKVAGRPVDELRLCGGQARSPIWAQMQADILGKPLLVSDVSEASGWGAALCAGFGIGYWSNLAEAAHAAVEMIPPQVAATDVYEDLYQTWLSDIGATGRG